MDKDKEQHTTLTEDIMKAVNESNLTIYAIAKGSGVPQPVLHRFMSRERGLTLETAEKLCRYLGLKLTKG